MHFRPLLYPVILSALLLLGACASTPEATRDARSYFEEGEAAYASRNYKEAIELLKKVKESDSSPELSTRAELKIADAHFDSEEYIEAAAAYEDFRKLHPTHEKAPYALYRLALSHYHQIAGIDTDQTPVRNAVLMLKTFLDQYPESEHAADAAGKLDDCRDKQLAYENYVGNFYLRTKKYPSALKRLKEALQEYPGLARLDETLFLLGKTHLEAGDVRQGRAVLQRLAEEYPASPRNKDAAQLLQQGFAGYTSQGG